MHKQENQYKPFKSKKRKKNKNLEHVMITIPFNLPEMSTYVPKMFLMLRWGLRHKSISVLCTSESRTHWSWRHLTGILGEGFRVRSNTRGLLGLQPKGAFCWSRRAPALRVRVQRKSGSSEQQRTGWGGPSAAAGDASFSRKDPKPSWPGALSHCKRGMAKPKSTSDTWGSPRHLRRWTLEKTKDRWGRDRNKTTIFGSLGFSDKNCKRKKLMNFPEKIPPKLLFMQL